MMIMQKTIRKQDEHMVYICFNQSLDWSTTLRDEVIQPSNSICQMFPRYTV